MATIVTRDTGASAVSRPLTISELDNNFINLDAAISAISAITAPKITGIAVTDSSYVVLDDTAVSTSGGYIKITGTGFTTGSQVLIGTVAASSVSWISSTELRAQVSATAAGTYVVYVVATDGAVAIRVNGITFSSTPTWSTGGSLGSSGATISIQLAAVSDTTITYSLAAGSTLPTGLSLSSSGLLSGTVTGVTVDTTYNFTITATDLEYQDSPRTFSITITVKDSYFMYVPLLLETAASSTRSTVVTDSSTANAGSGFTVTRNGAPSTGWTSPYQTDGYWGNYFPGGSSDTLGLATNAIPASGAFTFETFVYVTGTAASQCVISQYSTGNAGRFQILWNDTANKVTAALGAGNIFVSDAAYSINSWLYIVVQRDASNVWSMYVNGVRNSVTVTNATALDTSATYIGNRNGGGTPYTGYISNLRVVTSALYSGSTISVPTTPFGVSTANQTLLTCYSNRFIDANTATTAKVITVTGTPQVTGYYYPSGFTAPAASPGAGYFNGTTDYLTVASNTAFAFGSSDYTVEGWLYSLATTQQVFFASGGTGTNNFYFSFAPASSYIGVGNQSVFILQATGLTLSTGVWYHVAASRASGTLKLFLNGVQVASGADGTSWIQGGSTSVGNNSQGSQYFSGYISNLRIVKGTAVYTGAFTPPTGFLTTTGGTYSSTTNVNTSITASNTSLLVNLGDSNYTSATNGVQNNTFIDTGPYAFPITRNGTATQGSITPYWPDGQWSNYFAANGDYISVPDSANVELGASDFQMSAWIYLTAYPASNLGSYASAILSKGNFAGTRSYEFSVNGASGTSFGVSLTNAGGTSTGLSGSFSFALNTWYAVRVTRVSNRVYVFVNGTLLNAGGTAYTDTVSNGTDALKVGRSNLDVNYVYQFFGYISNVSLAIGGTGYSTASYTPTTTPTTATSDIKFLSCQSNRFKDNSNTPAVVSVTGTPTIQAFQPFPPAASYTTALYGGSGYFNGSPDYLSSPVSTSFALGTSNFTVEMWVYLITASGGKVAASFGNFATYDPLIGYLSAGSADFTIRLSSTGSSWNISDGSVLYYTLNLNSWNHIALVRNGSNIALYGNGSLIGSVTSNASIYQSANSAFIGKGQSAFYFPGYIANYRFVNGTAVYTSAFTPPTSPVTAVTNTSLLLNMANAGIYDAAAQNDIVTVGNAQASSTITAKWGTTSMRFDGSGSFLTMLANSNASTTITSGDFTIEFWLNPSTVAPATQSLVGTRYNDSANNINWGMYLAYNQLGFFSYSSAQTLIGSITHQTTMSINTWYHCALVRSGSTFTLYVNGVAGTSTLTSSATMGQFDTTLYVGRFGAVTAMGIFTGYIQDLRITRGVARTITTPTLAFQTR